MENKNHNKKKQQGKNLLKQKTNNKQIEEKKVVKSEQDIVQPKIFNLSKNTLSRYQINTLLRGWKFTPTPIQNIIQLKSYIHHHTQKLRLTDFFHNASKNNNLENFFKTKSSFTTSRNRDRDFDHQTDILHDLQLDLIQDGPFRGCSWMGGSKEPPLLKVCQIYPAIMKLGTGILYLKKTQKINESHDAPLEFC